MRKHVDRRGFLGVLLGEVTMFFEEVSGRPCLSLANLSQLPDELIVQIIPEISPGVEIIVAEDNVSAQCRGWSEPRIAFERDPASLFTFNLFNGLSNLAQIGLELAKFMSWSEDEGIAFTKNFFLQLAGLGICVPNNPVGD